MSITCKRCGANYEMLFNDKYSEGSYELKFINEADGRRYFSNKCFGYCPSCIQSGIREDTD